MKTIYELLVIYGRQTGRWWLYITIFPNEELRITFEDSVGCFDSVKDAEKTIKKMINKSPKYETTKP